MGIDDKNGSVKVTYMYWIEYCRKATVAIYGATGCVVLCIPDKGLQHIT